MYKEALKMKLRFATSKGNLSTEDLFSLSLQDLDKIAVGLDEELSKSPKKSFISDVTPETKVVELRFNIVKDIINTKLAEKVAKEQSKEKQAKKAQLMEILARKQAESLENLSEEELLKRIQELG